MGYDMCNCILLDESGMEQEEISAGEFATLKNDMHHVKQDLAEVKDNNKNTVDVLQAINLTLATMSEHVKQNQKLEPRIDNLESRADKSDLKIAAATGGATAIGLVIGYMAKLKGFFG